MLVYGILYFLVWRGIAIIKNHRNTAQTYVLALLITMLYAISDELHQSHVSGRHATPFDVGFDTIGAVFSLLLIHRFI
jgi:VanZ family protein